MSPDARFQNSLISAVLIITFAVLFLLYLLPAVINWLETDPDRVNNLGREAISASDDGQFAEAEAAFTTLLKTGELDARREAMTKRRLAIARFLQGGQNNQWHAVDLMKAVVVNEDYPMDQRGGTATALIDLYYAEPSDWLFQEVFTGEPFGHLAAGGAAGQELALRQAAEYADSLYPNPFSKLQIASWYARQLVADGTLSTAHRASYAHQIAELVDSSVLLAGELTEPFDAFMATHRGAVLLAVLALENPAYRAEFETQFTAAIELATGSWRSARTEAILPFTYFYYAAFLNELYGAERAEKINALLVDLINVLASDPDRESTAFVQFVKRERVQAVSDRDHNYRFLVALAERSPMFRNFLLFREWEL